MSPLGAEAQNHIVGGNQSNSAIQEQEHSDTDDNYSKGAPPHQQAAQQRQKTSNLPNPEARNGSKEDNGFWNGKFTDWAIVFLTFGLFVVGAIQAYIYCKQAALMRGALIATKRSNVAAMKAAVATEQSVERSDAILKHSEGTAERQLRAYMRVELLRETSISIKSIPGAGINDPHGVQTTIGIANSGQTPASNVTVHSDIIVAPFPLDKQFPEIEIENGGSKANVHPSQPVIGVEVFSNALISKPEFAKLSAPRPGRASTTRLYMYGKITYRDVFDKTRETNFRCVSDGSGVVGARFTWCNEGNDAT